jgi:hypothetical protein
MAVGTLLNDPSGVMERFTAASVVWIKLFTKPHSQAAALALTSCASTFRVALMMIDIVGTEHC